MHEQHLKPRINILFFILFFDSMLIIQSNQPIHNSFLYIIFFSFLMLVLSYFTDYLSKNHKIQEKLYNIFIMGGFPVFASFVVFYENFQTEAIFLFFVQLTFYIFYVKYKYYLQSLFLGIIVGFFIFVVTNDFHSYPLNSALYKQYFLFVFSIVVSIFLWKTIYTQLLSTLNAREKEIEENINMIVHDLNSPLIDIGLCARSVKKKYLEKDAFIEKNMDAINACVEQALFHIQFRKENLRSYIHSRDVETIDVKQFINDYTTQYLKTHNESVNLQIHGQTFLLNADINFLHSIFINLLHNACCFIKKAKKGSIIISLETLPTKNRIRFKDTGYGIKPDILPMIFNKGFSRRHDGTGMGLYMCRDLIQHLGGIIQCESVYGEYTEFIMEFPLKKH